MRQWKRMTAIILALCLLGTAFVVPAAAEQVTETITEKAAAEDGAEDAIETTLADHMLDELASIPPEKIAHIIAPYVSVVSEEELLEYIEMIIALLENEDFQSLMSYEEVRDLTVYAVENLAVMAAEDPELTQKVLETLEVNETLISVTLEIIDHKDEIGEVLAGLEEVGQSQEVQDLFSMLTENAELKNGLKELQSVLLQGEVGNE